jgi:bifunctional enzyme CysN/CysC
MSDQPMRAGAKLTIKHTSRVGRAVVRELRYRLEANSPHRDVAADQLQLSDIGGSPPGSTAVLFCDQYSRNRVIGGFILIDDATNRTVGAGMILGSG